MHPWFASLKKIGIDDLLQPMARDFARFISRHGSGSARLEGARRLEAGDEVLLVRIATGRPQRSPYPFLREEVVGILFSPNAHPYVMSAREDFPDIPHQNLVRSGNPYSLCIDDREWREAKLTYTPAELLQRIVIWFEKAGKDELHEVNQPLDPYFIGSSNTVILPGPVFKQQPDERCDLVVVQADEESGVLRLEYSSAIDLPKLKKMIPSCIFITCEVQPDRMSRLRAAPSNLAMLHTEMEARGTSVLDILAGNIGTWISEDDVWKKFRFESHLGILVKMPVIHPRTGQTGAYSLIAFVTECSLGDVGISLGRLDKNDKGIGDLHYVPVLNPGPIVPAAVEHIQLDPLNVTANFDSDLAARMAGRNKCDPRKVAMVGAGAVGSIVADSLAREGRFGWTIIDNDTLLPHNLARHALSGNFVGLPKAKCLAYHLQKTVCGCEASGIVADVIEPNDHAGQIENSLNDAEIILDASASVPVSRHLCDLPATARRAAFFFNPAGTAAVLMVEDAEREVDLRALEAAFYARILDVPALADILVVPPERLPYSGDCRAMTTRMPSSRAQILSGLISQGLGKALDTPQAYLQVWQLGDDGSVTVSGQRPEALLRYPLDEWTVRLLPLVADRLQGMRQDKLPSETGGALLGVVDITKKSIEIIWALPPPPDSEGRPTGFLRGTEGLEKMVNQCMALTLDHIRYVGEWHSHPRQCSITPSHIDFEQLRILSETLSMDGFPGVQLIIGDFGLNIYLGIFTEHYDDI